MPDGTGFDLLEQLEKVDFKIIFASAYDKFAIQAFKFSAIDYLQKPVEAEELMNACSRLTEEKQYSEINKKLEVLLLKLQLLELLCLSVYFYVCVLFGFKWADISEQTKGGVLLLDLF